MKRPWPLSEPHLIPLPPGEFYTLDSPPWNAMVTRPLARELSRVLDRFAKEAGFTADKKVELHFEPGVVGHHQEGRAADLYQIQRRRLDEWRKDWDRAQALAEPERTAAIAGQRRRNLGWRVSVALATYGNWARPPGYPVQLFGPWSRETGPHHAISDRLLNAHRDHIHIAL